MGATKKFFDTIFFWVIALILCVGGMATLSVFSFDGPVLIFLGALVLAVITFFAVAGFLKPHQSTGVQPQIQESQLQPRYEYMVCQKCNADKILVPASISCPVCDAPPYMEQFAERTPTKKKCPKCKSQRFMYPACIACPVCNKAPQNLGELPKQQRKAETRSISTTPSTVLVEQLPLMRQPLNTSHAKMLVGGVLLFLVVAGIAFIAFTIGAETRGNHTQDLRILDETNDRAAVEENTAKGKMVAEVQATNDQAAVASATPNVELQTNQEPRNYTVSVSADSQYKSVLGQVFPGIALYTKNTHSPFGFVVDVESGYVWVADSYTTDSANIQLYARKYERRFITDNFVTKK